MPPPPKASPELKKLTNELKQAREKMDRMQTQMAAAGVTQKGGKGGGKSGKSNKDGVSTAKHARLDSFTKEDKDNIFKQGLCMNYQKGECKKTSKDCPHKHVFFSRRKAQSQANAARPPSKSPQ